VQSPTYHRIYLLTLRVLCDLRKVAPVVSVENADDVNMSARQMHGAASESFSRRR
jgi:hypothetical protein